MRLDLAVNILTNHAINKGKITVFGGQQMRPNIHIDDVCDLYVKSLQWPAEAISGRVYNAGYENRTVRELAETVRAVVGDQVDIVCTPTDDNRSYHICSERIQRELGFVPKKTVEDAVKDLKQAFSSGLIPDPMGKSRYYNIKTMQGQTERLKAHWE
jgi:nucleoside-diphosphate-sugar epimerase